MTDVRSGKRLNRLSRDPRRAEGEASLDLGLAQLTTLVNRDIYPVDRYPAGQFEFAASISRATSAVVTVWLLPSSSGGNVSRKMDHRATVARDRVSSDSTTPCEWWTTWWSCIDRAAGGL